MFSLMSSIKSRKMVFIFSTRFIVTFLFCSVLFERTLLYSRKMTSLLYPSIRLRSQKPVGWFPAVDAFLGWIWYHIICYSGILVCHEWYDENLLWPFYWPGNLPKRKGKMIRGRNLRRQRWRPTISMLRWPPRTINHHLRVLNLFLKDDRVPKKWLQSQRRRKMRNQKKLSKSHQRSVPPHESCGFPEEDNSPKRGKDPETKHQLAASN